MSFLSLKVILWHELTESKEFLKGSFDLYGYIIIAYFFIRWKEIVKNNN